MRKRVEFLMFLFIFLVGCNYVSTESLTTQEEGVYLVQFLGVDVMLSLLRW